jgi:hypothetical protein
MRSSEPAPLPSHLPQTVRTARGPRLESESQSTLRHRIGPEAYSLVAGKLRVRIVVKIA